MVERVKDTICHWLVRNLMPKRLVYWAGVHIAAIATTGRYGNTIVPDLTIMEALGRYHG